jgi:hypothetical protein
MSVVLPDDLLELVLRKVQATPGAVALLLVGSAARGSMDRNSDWDFVCVVEDDDPWTRAYRDGGRETFAAPDGRQVELAFSSFSRLRRRMSEQTPEGIIATAEYLAEGLIIWPAKPDTRVKQLQSQARSLYHERPLPILPDDLAWRCYDIWNRVKDVEDTLDDPIAGYYLSFLPYWSLVTLYFRLARRWLPRPKAAFSAIEELDPELHSLCTRFTSATANAARHAVLCDMMQHLAREFGVEFERYYKSPAADPAPEV